MDARRSCVLAICLILGQSPAMGDQLKPLRELGKKALQAFEQHQEANGRAYFEDFLQKANASPSALRDTQIQVMMGVLGCALPEHRQLGRVALRYVLENGKGIAPIRDALQQVRDACSASGTVEVPAAPTMELVLVSASNGPGVSGKGGDPSASPVASVAVTAIDLAQMDKRMEETRDRTTALSPVLARVGSQAQGTVTDHFIVVTDGGGQKLAEGLAACLDRYRADLNGEFDMVVPQHLITVYNTQWDDMVPSYAGRLHGLRLAPGTIAYSVYADLSMAGVGSPEVCGSLAHELTHLMIKGNFGDAPAWLEEGLASAVALSVPENDHLNFHSGWRDAVLRTRWNLRPTVRELLSLTWADFSPTDYAGLQKAAAIQAMASVFVRYLAAKNKLHGVYFAVRKQDLIADLDHYRTAQQIVEEQLGKSMDEVDRDFVAWFKNQSMDERNGEKPCKRAAPARPMDQQQAPCEPERKNESL